MNKKDIMEELNNIVESQEAKLTMARELKLLYDSFITAGFAWRNSSGYEASIIRRKIFLLSSNNV